MRIGKLVSTEVELDYEGVAELRAYGKRQGFRNNQQRLQAYRKILFSQQPSKITEIMAVFTEKEPQSTRELSRTEQREGC